MKKLLLLTSTALLTSFVFFSSCTKTTPAAISNWTCLCAMTNSNGSYIDNIPENSQTQGAANTACAAEQVSHTSATTVAACQLQQQ